MITSLKPNETADIKGYEGLYAITSSGKVWSYPKIHGTSSWPGFWLKQNEDGSGYLFVSLQSNKVTKQPKVHRLVADSFIPNPSGLPQVNHIDGNKLNNRIDNLEWITAADNIRHSFRIGLSSQVGSKNAKAKLTESAVISIREGVLSGLTQRFFANKYSVSPAVINRVVRRKGWNHV